MPIFQEQTDSPHEKRVPQQVKEDKASVSLGVVYLLQYLFDITESPYFACPFSFHMQPSRRKVIGIIGATAFASVPGCTGLVSTGETGDQPPEENTDVKFEARGLVETLLR
jgi:hypothetical protein